MYFSVKAWPPIMSSSWSELTDNSSDEVSSCDEMENVLMAWPNVNDLSNACEIIMKYT